MIILVINCGSSSLKYQLIDSSTEDVLAKGLCEKIGLTDSFLKHKTIGKEPVVINKAMPDHNVAVKMVLDCIVDKTYGAISSYSEISAIGHRVVHGGEAFSGSVEITPEVINIVDECSNLAPLHNPPNLLGIKACQKILPGTPMVGIFDTAFHQTMPKKSYIYGIPYEFYEKYKIRRYGFHGTSHNYVSQKASEFVGKPLNELKIISCHLGNGASICAVKNGISVDTSMGYTPLEGLVMGTRSGSIDPAIVTVLMEKENLSISEINNLLNKKSGLLGLSEVSNDFRDIHKMAEGGLERAKLAIEVFCLAAKKYIGQYFAVLNGVDVLVYTAGIGENDNVVREKCSSELEALGISIDTNINNNVRSILKEKPYADISSPDSKVKVLVIPTNEELMIAKETAKVLK